MSIEGAHTYTLVLVSTIAAALAGCSSSTCTPGETRACVGSGACQGGQICNADGTGWSECSCASTSGSPDAGLMASAGGSGASVSPASTGGAPAASGGASSDCNASIDVPNGNLTVSNGAVTVGELQGSAFAMTWIGNGSSKEPCITPVFGQSALCAVGSVPADPSWGLAAICGFWVNAGISVDASVQGIEIANSITVTTYLADNKNGNSALRFEIVDMNNVSYCVEGGTWTSGTPIPIKSFNSACWDNSGEYASPGIAIQQIQFIVPCSNTVQRPFSFCITNVTVQ